jgi:hypothetical protein
MGKKIFTKKDMLQFKKDTSFFTNTIFGKKYKAILSMEQMEDKWFEEFEEKNKQTKTNKNDNKRIH